MEQKRFEKILNSLYPNLKVTSYQLWDRFTVDDNGEFKDPQSPGIFVEVKGEFQSIGVSIGEDISRMTGIEVVIDKFE
jgi:hypothetical protein